MSRADVIRMAQEAGLSVTPPRSGEYDGGRLAGDVVSLERFADLLADDVITRRPPLLVVDAATLDADLLRSMLTKAPPMPLVPMPADAVLDRERAARIAAQTENEKLKSKLAASGVAERRAVHAAVLAERDACFDAARFADNGAEAAAAIRARGAF